MLCNTTPAVPRRDNRDNQDNPDQAGLTRSTGCSNQGVAKAVKWATPPPQPRLQREAGFATRRFQDLCNLPFKIIMTRVGGLFNTLIAGLSGIASARR